MRNLFVICFVSGISFGESKLSSHSYISSCHKDDPDFDACVFKHAELAIPHLLRNGDRKYGIPKLNPLELEAITLETGGNLNMSLSRVKMFGLDTVSLRKARIDLSAREFHFDFKTEKINILGQYDLSGKILTFPLEGKGDCNITAEDIDIKFDLKFKLIEKNGETYMELSDINIDFETEKFHFQFDNLFNGNEELGKNMNKILNEEWKALYTEFKPAVTKTIRAVASSIIERMFNRVPYHMIFI